MSTNFDITPGIDHSITIVSGKIDNQTDLQIVGNSASNYGPAIAQNFVDLLTNFASEVAPPSKPRRGQLWYKNATKQLMVYVGESIPGTESGWSGIISTTATGQGTAINQGGTGLTSVGPNRTFLNSNGSSLEYAYWWDVKPDDGVSDIGSIGNRFGAVFTKNLYSENCHITNSVNSVYLNLSSDATILGSADISGSVSIGGALTVSGSLNANASSASKIKTPFQLSLNGDITGSVVMDGSQSVSIQTTADSLKVVKTSGGTMTGYLVLAADPVSNMQAATKQYVDGKVGNYLPLTGGTLSGTLVLANDASYSMGAVTKQQLDRVTALYTSGVVAGNTADIFPPYGWSMADLKAFCPSINQIYFAGVVNNDDSLFCYYQILGDRIRVVVYNSEQRATPYANYIAIWRKQ